MPKSARGSCCLMGGADVPCWRKRVKQVNYWSPRSLVRFRTPSSFFSVIDDRNEKRRFNGSNANGLTRSTSFLNPAKASAAFSWQCSWALRRPHPHLSNRQGRHRRHHRGNPTVRCRGDSGLHRPEQYLQRFGNELRQSVKHSIGQYTAGDATTERRIDTYQRNLSFG